MTFLLYKRILFFQFYPTDLVNSKTFPLGTVNSARYIPGCFVPLYICNYSPPLREQFYILFLQHSTNTCTNTFKFQFMAILTIRCNRKQETGSIPKIALMCVLAFQQKANSLTCEEKQNQSGDNMAGVAETRSPGVHPHKNNGRGCPSFMSMAPIHFNP